MSVTTAHITYYGANTTGDIRTCHYCGMIHDTLCPRIVEIEYHPNGTVRRIVFRGEER